MTTGRPSVVAEHGNIAVLLDSTPDDHTPVNTVEIMTEVTTISNTYWFSLCLHLTQVASTNYFGVNNDVKGGGE